MNVTKPRGAVLQFFRKNMRLLKKRPRKTHKAYSGAQKSLRFYRLYKLQQFRFRLRGKEAGKNGLQSGGGRSRANARQGRQRNCGTFGTPNYSQSGPELL
ncbi:MAG: hypothetical protein RSC00_02690, partial [Ruthenibacterium sp.]